MDSFCRISDSNALSGRGRPEAAETQFIGAEEARLPVLAVADAAPDN